MNPRHFRIGNILQDANGKIAIVEEITKDDGVKAYSGMVTSLPLKPVDLTEKWLLELGFIKDTGWDDIVYFEKDGIQIYENNEGYDYDNHKINYVHQLQNLFLDLTGNELELQKIANYGN